MITGPKVTLVLPYFNEAQFIARTIESLARQRDRRFSLILVDNASTDQSTRIVRETCAMILPGRISSTNDTARFLPYREEWAWRTLTM